MAEDRSWMYTGRREMTDCSQEWMEKTSNFVDRAFARRNGRGVLCPCSRCSNTRPQMRATMIAHLGKYGFRPGYTLWVYHGESQRSRSDVLREETDDVGHNESMIEDMLDDAMADPAASGANAEDGTRVSCPNEDHVDESIAERPPPEVPTEP